jgi:hypothetical protein
MYLRQLIENLLKEKAVTSDLTIGFEVECIVPVASMPSVEKLAKSINADIVDDSSIQPENRGNEVGKELLIGTDGEGAQMRATPQSIIKVSEFVFELSKLGVYTNKSCGLHAHFGIGELGRMSNIHNVWFTIWAVQNKMLDKYRNYNGTSLYDREYAPPQRTAVAVNDLLDDLDRYKQDENLHKERLFELLKERRFFDKYSTLFPHQQGTIEWRGFRGALDEGMLSNAKTILGYFKLAYKFAQDMARGVTESRNMKVGGYTLRDMEEMGGDRERNPDNPLNKDWNLFLKDSELNKQAKQYLNDYAQKIMADKKRDLKMRHGFMERLMDVIVDSQEILNWLADNSERPYTFKMDQLTVVQGFAIDNKSIILNNPWLKIGQSNDVRLMGIFNDCTFTIPDTSKFLTLKKSIDACTFMGKAIFKLPKADAPDADNMPWFQQLRASGAEVEIQALRF